MKSFSLPAAAALALLFAVAPGSRIHAADEAGFVSIFNGKDLSGWKSNEETPGSFIVEDGELRVVSGRAHLFYVGDSGGARFKDFEFKARVKHMPNSNSGIYIHTAYQAEGWPAEGYECQVNSTTHKDPKKTGGLYAVKDVLDKAPVEDGEWFDYHISVKGKTITIRINGEVTTEWTEPADWDPATALKNMPGRRLNPEGGTIALQAHDPNSIVHFKDLRLKILD